MSAIYRKLVVRELSQRSLVLLLSLYYTLLLNIPLYRQVAAYLPNRTVQEWLFLLSLPLLLGSVFFVLFSLFASRWLIKPLHLVLLPLSALAFYASLNYGVLFDHTMIQNLLETDSAEAGSYLSISSVLVFMLLGLLPMVLLLLTKITELPFRKVLVQQATAAALALLVMFGLALAFYKDYASVFRNHRELKHLIVPTNFIAGTNRFLRERYFNKKSPFLILDKHPQFIAHAAASDASVPPKRVVVLAIGETARAQSFAYYGYSRDTDPNTRRFNPLVVPAVRSCGTATAVSVPCMLSHLTAEDFSVELAENQQNVLDLLQLAGADVLWIDNNSGCKGMCSRVPNYHIDTSDSHPLCDGNYCFDQVLVDGLADKLANLDKPLTVVVLHMIGSHGPTYYRRYPREMAKFLPDCQRADIQNCDQQALQNTYDNTIYYTDFVLSEIMAELNSAWHSRGVKSSMIYVSDHGESLGEYGLYLHGFPKAIAPDEQTLIPMLIWQSGAQGSGHLHRCQGQRDYSHDNLFHTLLGLTGIESELYQRELDILAECEPVAVTK